MTERVNHFGKSESTSDLSLRELVAPLFRQKRAVLLTFVAALLVLALYFGLKGPTYASRMAILVNRERLDPLVSTESTTQMITNNTAVAPEEVNSEIELLTSRDVLEKVAIAAGMDQSHPGFSLNGYLHPNQTRNDRIARAVKQLAKSIKTEVTTKTNIIQVTYSSGDPQLAYKVLDALGRYYKEKHVAVHRPAGSYDFFANQTNKYKDELAAAETKLRDFSRNGGVAAPDIQRTNLALQLADSVGIQHLAEQTVAADEQRIVSDQDQLRTIPQRVSTQQISAAASILLDNLNTALLTAQTKRTQLVMKYEPTYPLVQETDQEIAATKAAIEQARSTQYVSQTTDRDPTFEVLREDLAKTQAELSAQRANLRATKQSIQSIQAQMVTLDQDAIVQNDLLREAKAAESNYLLYLSKREQERTTDALDSTRITNVAIAVPPAIPVLPVLSWISTIVVIVGVSVVLSVVSAYGFDYFDSSFHTPAQVMEGLGIPIVISVTKKSA